MAHSSIAASKPGTSREGGSVITPPRQPIKPCVPKLQFPVCGYIKTYKIGKEQSKNSSAFSSCPDGTLQTPSTLEKHEEQPGRTRPHNAITNN